jgi:hypothetical protein
MSSIIANNRIVQCGGLCVQKRKADLQGGEVLVRVGLCDDDQCDASALFGVLAPQAQQVGLRELVDHDLQAYVLGLLPR